MMNIITESVSAGLSRGDNVFEIVVTNTLDVTLNFPPHSEGSLFLIIKGEGTLNLKLDIYPSGTWKYLWINQSDTSLNVNETIVCHEQVQLTANYAEMTRGAHEKNTRVELLGSRSHVDFRGAVISFNQLKWQITAAHLAKKTFANVQCNAIVLDNGRLHLEVIGKITKGNSGSETHQMSRILNLGENVHGVVYPMLLIDENDVAASHAASVGQPDEEQIYYLQSRGLTRLESLKLIVTGYLLPILEGIDDQTIKQQLHDEIVEKVNSQWQ